MKETFFTVHAIARNKEGKYLVLQRALGRSNEGRWNCVSGFVKEKEPANEAALRELKEETGLIGKVARLLEPFWIDINNDRWVIVACLIEVETEDIVLDGKEHSNYKWVEASDPLIDQTLGMYASMRNLGLK